MADKTAEIVKEGRFEDFVSELDRTVRDLEGGNLTLDQSLLAFERGIGLVRQCEKKLDEAKAKVEKLVKDANGGVKTENFEPRE